MWMASCLRRWKWSILMGRSLQNFCFLSLVVFLFCGMVYIIISVKNRHINDGTFIDLSPARQRELVDEWVRERKKRKEFKTYGSYQSYKTTEAHLNNDNDLPTRNDLDKDYANENLVGVITNTHQSSMNHDSKDKSLNGVVDLMVAKKQSNGTKDQGGLTGGFAECRLYDVEDDIQGEFECLKMNMKPDVIVCLYPIVEDIHVSGHLHNLGMWEGHIVKELQNMLYSDPDLAFIDVGAHIGMYSLIAANMGHQVVAVEPQDSSLARLHKAVKLSGVEDRIVVLRNVISDHRKMVSLKMFKDNQGGTQISKLEPCFHKGCMPSAKSIVMDDLLEVINFKKAALKIDIEGNEHRAFRHSQKFFSQVFVPYIFMEWRILRSYYGSEVTESEDKAMTGWLVDYLMKEGYTPHSSVTGAALTPRTWYGWSDDIIWRHELSDFN